MSKELPKILAIGQALPEKPVVVPFERTRLYKWLNTVEITKEEFIKSTIFNAILDFYPGQHNGKDRVPTDLEIKKNIPRLINIIEAEKINLIIPIGKIAIQTVLSDNSMSLENTIGKSFYVKPFNIGSQEVTIIPLPHPSGLSTWVYQNQNKDLLDQAMNLIKNNFTQNTPKSPL